ncbi:hypothetical protein EV121DRAFT_194666 [Schizophyllum commune]
MSHTLTAMSSTDVQQLKTNNQSQAPPTSLGDLQKLDATSKHATQDEPPEWFAEVTSAIADSMTRLYGDTSSQLDETTLCVMRALSNMAKLSNVLVRTAGLTSGYEIVPFVDGSWPPSELPPLVSDDAVDSLGRRERHLYLAGYGVREWNEETWQLLLFEAIGAPIDLPLPEDSGPMEV